MLKLQEKLAERSWLRNPGFGLKIGKSKGAGEDERADRKGFE